MLVRRHIGAFRTALLMAALVVGAPSRAEDVADGAAVAKPTALPDAKVLWQLETGG
jgi:hypothetical protein